MPLMSMTGYATLSGAIDSQSWIWEARSVNGRGLDLRLRLPEGCEALESDLRTFAAKTLVRGSVTIGLRLSGGTPGSAVAAVDVAGLDAAIAAARAARDRAAAQGLELAPVTTGDLLSIRGVLAFDAPAKTTNVPQIEALGAQIQGLLAALKATRAEEGAALAHVLLGQVAQIETFTQAARTEAAARGVRTADLLHARVAALLAETATIDASRLAQELALLAVKADVSEELDRLSAHVDAAQGVIARDGPMGRKLDFLTQEFNREASTLCAKAGSAPLTAIGLELKVVIDQMREQVQNVE